MPAENPAVRKSIEMEAPKSAPSAIRGDDPPTESFDFPGPDVRFSDEAPADAPPRCPKHPENPQKQDKRGVFMGMCRECLADRGRRGRETVSQKRKRQIAANPEASPLTFVSLENPYPTLTLTFPEHLHPLYDWLQDTAAAQFRTLEMQVLYLVHLAKEKT